MNDRLNELLNDNSILFGMLCRDPRMTDLELLAKTGYHLLWIDMEHSPYNPEEIVKLCRTTLHLGMVPMVRIVELVRTHIQLLLDGGAQIIILPNARNATQTQQLVRLCKYPPIGARGLSSSAPALGYNLEPDLKKVLQEANTATHLMIQIESDVGFDNLESMCATEGIDMVTVGPADWAVELEIFGPERVTTMAAKEAEVLKKATAMGKITAATVTDEKKVRHYLDLGVRIIFTGVDIHLKRIAYAHALEKIRKAST